MYAVITDVEVLEAGTSSFRNDKGEEVQFRRVVLASMNTNGYQETLNCSVRDGVSLPAVRSRIDAVVDITIYRGSKRVHFVSYQER